MIKTNFLQTLYWVKEKKKEKEIHVNVCLFYNKKIGELEIPLALFLAKPMVEEWRQLQVVSWIWMKEENSSKWKTWDAKQHTKRLQT